VKILKKQSAKINNEKATANDENADK